MIVWNVSPYICFSKTILLYMIDILLCIFAEFQSNTGLIIGAVLGGVGGILFLILLIVCVAAFLRWVLDPDSEVHGAHLGPTGPRWAPCWPHELCYVGTFSRPPCTALTAPWLNYVPRKMPDVRSRYALYTNMRRFIYCMLYLMYECSAACLSH